MGKKLSTKQFNELKKIVEAQGADFQKFAEGSEEYRQQAIKEGYENYKEKFPEVYGLPVDPIPEPDVPPPTPTCGGHSHWNGTACVCDPGYHDENGECVLDAPHPPPPPPPNDNVLYDSNRDGHWDNGEVRTVNKSEGNIGPNGKGLYMAASGSPVLEILGNGEARLRTKPGFGRFYVAACNYNASLEFEFNIMAGSVDNLSTKCRSRHQMGGACENRFGGLGTHVALDECGFKAEKCHNIQDQTDSQDAKLKKPLQLNTWYKSKYEYKDAADGKSIEYTRWLDYNDGAGWIKVLEGSHKHPLPFYMDKPLYEKQSEWWTRLNGSGIVALRNMRLMAL
jgi:hypothetical protein